MNWIDIVALIAILLMAYRGYSMGLVRAVFLIAGLFLAMIIAAQVSDPVAGWITDSVKSDSVATVVAYAIVGGAVLLGSVIAGNLLNKVLRTVFLGWVDKLGGAVAGAITGFMLGAALVAILARLTFLIPETFVEDLSPIDVREGMRDSLLDSAFVPAYLDVYDFLPGKALGTIPGDFDAAIDELDKARENEDG